MGRIVYVNGRYQPYGEAGVHVEDRGFQFADAVYEVFEVIGCGLVDETRHLNRLERSLRELSMPLPMSRGALRHVIGQVIRRNRVRHGSVYLQVSRGAAPRDFAFPSPDIQPTVVCLARSANPARYIEQAAHGIAVATMPDIRWGRCDIKTVMLLPACLAKRKARSEGAREAWLVDREGFVTEGASSNAWIINRKREIITHPAGATILSGVTRQTAIDLIGREGLALIERPFTVAEALDAEEAFITAATNTVMPVVTIDGKSIGNGKPGLITLRLRTEFHNCAETAKGQQF
jgi:D-alanine transaminase